MNDLEQPAFDVLPELATLKRRLIEESGSRFSAVFMTGTELLDGASYMQLSCCWNGSWGVETCVGWRVQSHATLAVSINKGLGCAREKDLHLLLQYVWRPRLWVL